MTCVWTWRRGKIWASSVTVPDRRRHSQLHDRTSQRSRLRFFGVPPMMQEWLAESLGASSRLEAALTE